jgi:hypothetical protein
LIGVAILIAGRISPGVEAHLRVIKSVCVLRAALVNYRVCASRRACNQLAMQKDSQASLTPAR